jgi:hypothetical protein
VDQQPMRIRIDLRNSAVMPLEVQAVGCDRAFEQMMRRARGAGAGGAGRARERTHGLRLVFRRLSVGDKRRARQFHPGLDLQCFGGACAPGERGTPESGRTADEKTPIDQAISGRGLARLRLSLRVHRPLRLDM